MTLSHSTLCPSRVLRLCLALLAMLPASALAAADSERFKSIYEAEWAFRLREFPMFASYVGVHDYDDRMGRVSTVFPVSVWRAKSASTTGFTSSRWTISLPTTKPAAT